MTRRGKYREWFPSRIALLANFIVSFLIVAGAGAAALKIPIERVAGFIGLLAAFSLSGILCFDFSHGKLKFRRIWAATTMLVAALTILWPTLQHHRFVSMAYDAWNYSGFGQYLLKYPRGTEGGLSIVDQWVAGLSVTRFATPALLGIFASWLRSDTCRSTLPFAILMATHLGLGFALFTRIFGGARFAAISAGIFACLFGWIPELLKIANFDNLVFVSLLPLFLVRFRLLLSGGKHRMGIVGFSLCFAATVYAYPEGAAIAGIVFLPLVGYALVRCASRGRPIVPVIIGLFFGIILALPYLRVFWRFLRAQLNLGTEAIVARGLFAGLLDRRALPAFLALGEQSGGLTITFWNLLLPALLFVLLAAGFVYWWKRCIGVLLCIVPLALLLAWQGLYLRYDYGLYKVIVIGWILVVSGIFVGLTNICKWLFRNHRQIVLAAAVPAVFGMTFSQEHKNRAFAVLNNSAEDIRSYEELSKCRRLIGSHTLRIICDSPFKEFWGIFYLRDLNIELPVGHLVQARLKLLTRAKQPPEEASYTLVDTPSKDCIWKNRVYSIHKTRPLEICGVWEPRGLSALERQNGKISLWLNNEPMNFVIASSRQARATLSIGELVPGPSRIGDSRRTLILRNGDSIRRFPALGSLSLDLSLRHGINSIEMWCEELPDVKSLPNGDPRTLLIGLGDIQVKPSE